MVIQVADASLSACEHFILWFSTNTMTENNLPPIDSLFQKPSTNGIHGEDKKEQVNLLHPDEADLQNIPKGTDSSSHTWKKYGFLQSKNHNANPIALELELHKLLEQFKKSVQTDEKEQAEMKAPVRARVVSLELDIQKLSEQTDRIRKEKIPAQEKKMQEVKNEIGEIRRNPDHYKEKPSKLGLVLMGLVLVLLTVYLWIFYTSASYSAFFRQFTADDINVANSIFDPRAIANAWEKGAPALVLVITMPFIFLGLGILMHKFLEEKHFTKWIKLSLVIAATFVFDYIIAYEIVKKIYDLQALNSLENLPPYSYRTAFSDINFWLIIFAGFVTYLIWGFLFEKFMTENRKLDHAGEHIRVREKELLDIDKEIKKLNLEADTLDKSQHGKERDKALAENELNAVFFRPREVEYVIYHYMSGWMQYIEGGLMATSSQKEGLRNETRKTVMNFLDTQKPKYIHETA
ncbi:MAG TPA: hypothetical protein VK166_15810 [Chitinophagaceae bacterium]|nr:hypothetical protein [Chitinophagaceae bacterium]